MYGLRQPSPKLRYVALGVGCICVLLIAYCTWRLPSWYRTNKMRGQVSRTTQVYIAQINPLLTPLGITISPRYRVTCEVPDPEINVYSCYATPDVSNDSPNTVDVAENTARELSNLNLTLQQMGWVYGNNDFRYHNQKATQSQWALWLRTGTLNVYYTKNGPVSCDLEFIVGIEKSSVHMSQKFGSFSCTQNVST